MCPNSDDCSWDSNTVSVSMGDKESKLPSTELVVSPQTCLDKSTSVHVCSAIKWDRYVYKRRKLHRNSLNLLSEGNSTANPNGLYGLDSLKSADLRSQIELVPNSTRSCICCVREHEEPEKLFTGDFFKYTYECYLRMYGTSSLSKPSVGHDSNSTEIAVRDSGECSSFDDVAVEPLTNFNSVKERCIFVLENHGLLGGYRTSTSSASLEVMDDNDNDKLSQSCRICGISEHPIKMLICDLCEEAFHASCCKSEVKVLSLDKWHCRPCLKRKRKTLWKKHTGKSFEIKNRKRLWHVESHVSLMLKDVLPYTSKVRIGKKFQAEIPDVCIGKEFQAEILDVRIGEEFQAEIPDVRIGEEFQAEIPDSSGPIHEWTPCDPAANAINHAIRSQFRGPHHCWSATDQDVKDFWWKEFCEKISWNPRDEAYIKKLFQQKAAKRLSDMLSKVRKKGTRPSWMGEEAWRDLHIVWNGEDFKKISTQNKTNRASSRGGAVHTTGRTAHLEVALKMARKLGQSVDPAELFKTTHTKKSGDWVDERSRSTYRQYHNRMMEIKIHIGDSSTEGGQEVDGATKLELWKETVGGKKRGRCYGTADLSSNLRRGISSPTQESRAPSSINDGSEQVAENALLCQEVTAAHQEAVEANRRYVNLEEQFRAMDCMTALERQ